MVANLLNCSVPTRFACVFRMDELIRNKPGTNYESGRSSLWCGRQEDLEVHKQVEMFGLV